MLDNLFGRTRFMDHPDTEKLLTDLDAAAQRVHALADQIAASASRLKRMLAGMDDPTSVASVLNSEFDHYFAESQQHQKQLRDAATSIEQQRQVLQPILLDAQVDSLTGLLTRRGFAAKVRRSFSADSDTSPPRCLSLIGTCLAVIDIDQFKRINDTHGHAAGDEALRHVAKRLSGELHDQATLGRLGGDEFIAVSERPLDDFAQTLDHIRTTVADDCLEFDDSSCNLRFSVGLGAAVAGEDLDTVIRRADRALYEAKQRGRNRVCVHRGDTIDEFVSPK